MKKTILTLALFLGSLIVSQAQFSTDPANNLKISDTTTGVKGYSLAKMLPNGDTYIAYESLEPNEGGIPGSSYFLKLEMYDKKGNTIPGWKQGGMYISKNFTATYETQFGMEVTPDGSVILVYSDSRDNVDRNNPISRPYVYKVNNQGKHVWDSLGVAMVSEATQCLRPKIFLDNSGNPIITWNDITNKPSSAVFTRLNPETGAKVFEPVAVPGAIQPLVVPSDGDNLIIIYKTNPEPEYVTAVKYDRGGNRITTGAWATPIQLGNYTVMTNNAIASAQSDGEGGAIVCWHGVNGSSHYSMIQRITKDGILTMGDNGTRASGTFVHCTTPYLAVDKTNKEAYVFFIRHYTAEQKSAYVSKLNYNGQFIYSDSVKLIAGDQYDRTAYGLTMTENGVIGVMGSKPAAATDNKILTAFGMNRDGSIRWGGDTVVVSSMQGDKSDIYVSNYSEKEVIITFRLGTSVYAQNLTFNGDFFVGMNPISINAAASFKTYPNPATDQVNVQLNLTSRQKVNIEIIDVQGHKVAVLANNQMQDGVQTYVWKTAGIRKGIYFVSVRVGQSQKTSKVILQ